MADQVDGRAGLGHDRLELVGEPPGVRLLRAVEPFSHGQPKPGSAGVTTSVRERLAHPVPDVGRVGHTVDEDGRHPTGLPHERRAVRGSGVDCRGGGRSRYRPTLMSKKTDKRKTNARRKKANHGRKPNAGR